MAHTLIGIVSSDKRDKTITVSITNRETHPLYRKQYTKTRKYTAHDEKNEAHVGDKVEITSCRPLSKTKSYKLVKIDQSRTFQRDGQAGDDQPQRIRVSLSSAFHETGL